ncbi:MAG: hypothetical protein H0X28_15060 [Solirubrobacterales bacterium]|nr:hypothetical protein [Solirubrobacterales bacterium]
MWSKDDVAAMLINPIYAISIHPDLTGTHEPIVTKQLWIEANQKLIEEVGAQEWLRRLLVTLEGNFPARPEDPTTAFGYKQDG